MSKPTPEAIEAAARALYEVDYDDWDGTLPRIQEGSRRIAATILAAAAPFIAAQAKAEALTQFADAHRMPEPMFMDDGRAVTVGDLLREQAAAYRTSSEGEEFLNSAMADPEGRRLAAAAVALAMDTKCCTADGDTCPICGSYAAEDGAP